jgi:hypothetical protein
MNQQLLVRIRNVYGCPAIYPVNETASSFAKIAGTKTLSHPVLEEAERLGFRVVVEPEPVPQSVAKWARA